jgi:hypothetical protein
MFTALGLLAVVLPIILFRFRWRTVSRSIEKEGNSLAECCEVGKAGVVVVVVVGVVRFLLFILCGWWVGSNFEEDVKEMVERCLAVISECPM